MVWDVITGQAKATLEEAEDAFIYAVFSPDGKRVAAAGFGGTGFVWDVATGEQIAVLEGHTGTIWQIVYSPRGDMIATAGEDGTARLWDSGDGKQLSVLHRHNQAVLSVAFGPGGDQVATGGLDGTVCLWNTQTSDLEAVLPEYKVTEMLVTVNERLPVDGQAIRVVASDEPLELPWISYISYSPSGDRVVAASMDGSVNIYVADTDKLLEVARSQVKRQLTCEERVQFLYEDLDCRTEEALTPFPRVTNTLTR
jgi:WD40 repeat protein